MIEVRRMTAEDLPQVLEIERICFSEPWTESVYRATLLLPYADYYVTEAEGEIIGTCGVRRIAGTGEITNVAVLPEHRGFGLARRMLAVLIEEAVRNEVEDFTLEVRAGNLPAIRTYEKLGFVVEGRRPGFYESPKEDALILWKRRGLQPAEQ